MLTNQNLNLGFDRVKGMLFFFLHATDASPRGQPVPQYRKGLRDDAVTLYNRVIWHSQVHVTTELI